MKIIFICGGLEYGRDGVGDYTRLLSAELKRNENDIKIIALNDKHINILVKVIQACNNQNIEVLRLPSVLQLDQRLTLARDYIDGFDPEYISLQYVPFSFQKKGIPIGLALKINRLTKDRKWNIMFHETWVGITKLSPLKHKIFGFFQKLSVNLILRRIKFVKISTTNRLYQIILKNEDIDAQIIPLFSNIPFSDVDAEFKSSFYERLLINEAQKSSYCLLGIFGSLYPEANLEDVIRLENDLAKNFNKKLIFISFGRLGNVVEFERLKKIFEPDVQFVLMGELSESKISNLLQILDKGISCTPVEHIGKSGVYAAMRLHELKVLLPVSDPIPEFNEEIIAYNKYLTNRASYKWDVKHIGEKYLEFLNC